MTKVLSLCALILGQAFVAFPLSAQTLKLAVPIISNISIRDSIAHERAILDLIAAECGMVFNFEPYPLGAHIQAYETKDDIDGVSNVLEENHTIGHRAESHYYLHNSIIYRSDKEHRPQSLAQLAGLRVVTFPGAKNVVTGFADVYGQVANYIEVSNQKSMVQLLMADRVDAIVADNIITLNHSIALEQQRVIPVGSTKKLRHKIIMEPRNSYLYFKDKSISDRFSQCYLTLTEKGVTGQIYRNYQIQYPEYYQNE